MAVMERRLQLLLDQDRFAQVEREARESGRSIAAVIREAIDVRFDRDRELAKRAEAARRFLEMARASEDEPVFTTKELKESLEQEMIDRLERSQ